MANRPTPPPNWRPPHTPKLFPPPPIGLPTPPVKSLHPPQFDSAGVSIDFPGGCGPAILTLSLYLSISLSLYLSTSLPLYLSISLSPYLSRCPVPSIGLSASRVSPAASRVSLHNSSRQSATNPSPPFDSSSPLRVPPRSYCLSASASASASLRHSCDSASLPPLPSLHSAFRSVPSRPVPSHPVPSHPVPFHPVPIPSPSRPVPQRLSRLSRHHRPGKMPP
jgi:hypothetical protein